ncbi:hypothetical protein SAMN05443244_0969 [Terriglobus roseus]|uniref:Uncharacterized protein n=1 Tax=Terriglobus roseus TaxID=392734 RepID=A0A1H4K349_9BACT|nr:hypothetical protein SAMN05443244_0969 [Terriglobus roseus]
MTYNDYARFQREGLVWRVTPTEPRGESHMRDLTFASRDTVEALAERGGAMLDLTARQALDQGSRNRAAASGWCWISYTLPKCHWGHSCKVEHLRRTCVKLCCKAVVTDGDHLCHASFKGLRIGKIAEAITKEEASVLRAQQRADAVPPVLD